MIHILLSLATPKTLILVVLMIIALYVIAFPNLALRVSFVAPAITWVIGLPIMGILALPLSVVALLLMRSKLNQEFRINKSLLATVNLFLAFETAAIVHNHSSQSVGLKSFYYTIAALGMFLVASTGRITTSVAIKIYLANAAFISLWVLLHHSYNGNRIDNVFGQTANGIGMIVAPAIVIVVEEILSRSPSIRNLITVPLMVIFISVLIRVQSQGAILAIALGVIAMLIARGIDFKTVLALSAGFLSASLSQFWFTRSNLDVQSSREVRVLAAQSGLQVAKEHIFLGVGPGQTAQYIFRLTGIYMSSHNQYLEALCTGGAICGILFMTLMVRCVQNCRENSDAMLIGPVIAIATASLSIVWIDFPVLSFMFVLILGSSFALGNLDKSRFGEERNNFPSKRKESV